MNQSLKAVTQLLAIICGIVSFCAWAIPRHPDEVVWASRVLFPLVTVNVYFQNRYSGSCTCDLIIQPGGKSFSLGRHDVPTVAVVIDCPGGAAGVTQSVPSDAPVTTELLWDLDAPTCGFPLVTTGAESQDK